MQAKSTGKAARNDAKLAGAVKFIMQNLDEPLSLNMISEHSRISRFHFHRLFNDFTGMNVGRFVLLARLKRPSMQLVFNRQRSITDIALDAGFEYPESFTRAIRREYRQTPFQFRRKPDWETWWDINHIGAGTRYRPKEYTNMQVDIVEFPETLVAALEHHGPESQTYKSSMKFIEWRQENDISPDKGKTYGIHYTDPKNTFPEDFRMDICVSVENEIGDNPQGVINKVIPACRCAVARHEGSRDRVLPAEYLVYQWLPESGEEMGDFPVFFHYLNVGPHVKEHEMITDVYLPLK